MSEQPGATVQKAGPAYIYLVSFVAAIGGFIWGYDIVIMSSVILFLEPFYDLSSWEKGFAMSSATIGIIVGLITCGRLADFVGRKWTMFGAAILFGISAIGTAFPIGFADWNIYRVIGGIGAGLAMMVSPMYLAEIAPANRRGFLVLFNQLAVVLGAFLSALAGYWIAEKTGESVETAWRWMLISECIPIIPFVVGLYFIPRSPRWLVEQGNLDEAREVLTKIDGAEHAERELQDIGESLGEETGTFSELFLPGIRMALLIAIALAAFQQWTGQSSMGYYVPSIFEDAGIGSKSDAIFQMIILRIWNTAWTVFAILTVDRLGRRPLLLWGCLGMALGLGILGVTFQLEASPKILLLAMFISEASYIISLAPVTWVLISEVFPTRIRARGMMVAILVLQGSALIVNWGFPVLRDYFTDELGLKGLIFWLFSLVCLGAWVFCYFMVPETKGKTLEEIQRFWMHGKKEESKGD